MTETSHHGRIPLALGWRLVVYVTFAVAAWAGVGAVVLAVIVLVAGAGARPAHAHAAGRRGHHTPALLSRR